MKILSRIKKFFQESLLKARIANSQDLEYENRIVDALKLLNKYESIAYDDHRNRIEYFLIRSRLKHKVQQFQDSLNDALIAKQYIEQKSDNCGEIYLKKYLYFLLKNIYYSLNDKEWKFYEKLYSDIDISKNNKDELLEQWFPLPNIDRSEKSIEA